MSASPPVRLIPSTRSATNGVGHVFSLHCHVHSSVERAGLGRPVQNRPAHAWSQPGSRWLAQCGGLMNEGGTWRRLLRRRWGTTAAHRQVNALAASALFRVTTEGETSGPSATTGNTLMRRGERAVPDSGGWRPFPHESHAPVSPEPRREGNSLGQIQPIDRPRRKNCAGHEVGTLLVSRHCGA